MSNKLHFDIEFRDGSGGPVFFNTEEEAWAAAKAACEANPDARIWYADEIMQAGWIAADEVGAF